MLANIEMELAICAVDIKTLSSLALSRGLLILEMTTPGMARNPTFAVSITVDWDRISIVKSWRIPGHHNIPRESALPTLLIICS